MPKKTTVKKQSKQQGLISPLKPTPTNKQKPNSPINLKEKIYLFLLFFLPSIIINIFLFSPLLDISEFSIRSHYSYFLHQFLTIMAPFVFSILMIYFHHSLNSKNKKTITTIIFILPLIILNLYIYINYFLILTPFVIISLILIINFLLSEYSRINLLKKISKFILTFILGFIFIFHINSTPSLKIFLDMDSSGYEGCGKDFYQSFIQHAKKNDSSLCFNQPQNINYTQEFKQLLDKYCLGPGKNKIIIETKYLNYNFTSSCLTAFAIYTNDLSHCQYLKDEQNDECLIDYAIAKNQPEICDLITSTERKTQCQIRIYQQNN